MARKPPRLTVRYSPKALISLDEIWGWNAEYYDVDHADEYIQYLRGEFEKLATEYLTGRVVQDRADLRYIVVRRNLKKHGHIAVYRFDRNTVTILRLFHTAEDWKKKI
jgi:plasmid stabilization system protein ParE